MDQEREIELPDGTVLVFPAGTPDDQIRQAVAQRQAEGPQTRGLFGTNFQVPTSGLQAAKEFGGNILKSGVGAVKGLADTVVGAGNLMMGNYTPQGDALVQAVSNPGKVAQAYGDRYGGADNIAKTLWEDPVGAGLDIAGVMAPAGGAMRSAGQGLQRSGMGLMRRAANVPESVIATSPYQLDDLTIPQTMLQHGINPTTGGRRKLDNIIAPLGDQKRQLVEQSAQTFNAHDPRTTQGLRDFIGEGQVADSTSPALAPAGQNVLDTFTGGSKYNRPYTPIRMSQGSAGRPIQAGPVQTVPETQSPIQLASNDKMDLGRQISDSAWATNPADAATEANTLAQRALYGDLQAVEARIPGVAGVNRQLSPLMGTRDHLVKGLGVPEHYVSYPSPGAALAAVANNSFGAAGGFAARGANWAGEALGTLGQSTPTVGGVAAGFSLPNMLQQETAEEEAFRQLSEAQGDWWSPQPRLRP